MRRVIPARARKWTFGDRPGLTELRRAAPQHSTDRRSSAQEEIDDHQYGEQNQAGDEAAEDEFLLDRQQRFGLLVLDFFTKIRV
jgi:hypothetical protein